MDNERMVEESGILLVDKPMDWTSHDVVKFVRCFGFKKVGHCGTLDPQATGVLVLVLGRATKLTDRFTGHDKVYNCTMEIGKITHTEDAAGDVLEEYDWSAVTPERVREVAAGFVGEQMQVPPMVSAKKLGGKRLYKLARQGITVEREAKPITIKRLDISRIELPEVDFSVECTKGTYVRTLCADMGQLLGCGAFLKRLQRTASGPFKIEDAVDIETIKGWDRAKVLEHFIPLEKVLTYIV